MKEGLPLNDIVLVADERSKKIHRGLFNFTEDAYRLGPGDFFTRIGGLDEPARRVHIVLPWRDMVRLAIWTENPSRGDVLVLSADAGMSAEELLPFKGSDIGDLFPYLVYGKRFGVLRKICRIASKSSERHMKNKDVRVHCHLVSEDADMIIASSL